MTNQPLRRLFLWVNDMDEAEIKRRVQRIEDMSGDHEAAHSEADQFYIDVIKFVAGGGILTKQMAEEVLAVEGIEFSRHCA